MMITTPRAAAVCVVMSVAVLAAATAGSAQDVRSAALAKQLTAKLAAQQLNTFAMKDPAQPDRYIAAMVFPDVQILLVAARYSSPPYLDHLISQKQFPEAYAALQQGAIDETKLFVHDMGADGLTADGKNATDIVYEKGKTQTVFDGDWKKQRLNEREYREKFDAFEKQYAQLLGLLLAAATTPPGGAPAR